MAAVQLPAWPIDRDIHCSDPARTKGDRLAACLADRPVAYQPDITRKKFLVRGQNLFEVDRVRFFLALESELDIRFRLQPGRANRVERCHHGYDGRFVV